MRVLPITDDSENNKRQCKGTTEITEWNTDSGNEQLTNYPQQV